MTTENSSSRERIFAFLGNNNVGVLATADSSGKPHAATVYIAFDQHLNLYFVTKKETQKSRNVKMNPRAAIAIYNQASQTTVQAEGNISEITDPAQQERVFNDIWGTAFKISQTGPPTTQINAGGYIVYKLSAPTLRIATFTIPPGENQKTFEVVATQPLP